MKNFIKTVAWTIRHPKYAYCWFRHGLPWSSVHCAIIAIAAMFLLMLPMQAQTDYYGVPRTIVLLQTNLVSTTTVLGKPIDIHGFAGVGAADLYWNDTLGTNILWARLEGSSDNTNWTTITTASTATLTSLSYTNVTYTNIVAVNPTWVPGTITTATPATDGFYGKYLTPALFTSTAVFLTNSVGSGYARLGLVMPDLLRYIRVNLGTSSTVDGSVVVTLTGRRESKLW